jgi:hypothetical protein
MSKDAFPTLTDIIELVKYRRRLAQEAKVKAYAASKPTSAMVLQGGIDELDGLLSTFEEFGAVEPGDEAMTACREIFSQSKGNVPLLKILRAAYQIDSVSPAWALRELDAIVHALEIEDDTDSPVEAIEKLKRAHGGSNSSRKGERPRCGSCGRLRPMTPDMIEKTARATAAKIVDDWFGDGDANYLRETGSLENAIAAALSSATARGEAQERERCAKIADAEAT